MSNTMTIEQTSTVRAEEPPSPSKYLTIDGLLKSHATDSSNPVLIGYPAKGVSDFEEFTAKDLDRFADAAVAKYISRGLPQAVRNLADKGRAPC